MAFTILIAFVSLIGLIVIHEFGHFILAKKFGVKVEEFGIGLPPRIFGKKIGETIFSLNLLPFGAFVKIYGEEEKVEDSRSFRGRPIWQRALIVLGGVISFWIISAILLSIAMGLGVSTAVEDEANAALVNPRVQIVAVAPNSPAEKAGMKVGDTIKEFKIQNSKFKIQKVKQVQTLTEKYKGKEVILTIERGKEVFDVSLTPRISSPIGEGPMGVALIRTAIKSYPWYEAPVQGVLACGKLTWSVISGLAKVLENVIRGLPPGAQLMGPIGIGALFIQAAQLGLSYFLQLVAMVSIFLAVFNLLPIPAVDGGKLLFLGIEKVRKRPINPEIEQKITTFFFAVLIVLLIWVTIRDVAKLF